MGDYKDLLDLRTSSPISGGDTMLLNTCLLWILWISMSKLEITTNYRAHTFYFFIASGDRQTACNYPLTHSLHGRATHRLLVRIRGRFCSVPFSNILWKYICNLRLWCFYIIEYNSNVIVWFIWYDAKSCRSCVVSNLHRVPVKPSPRPCNCHNHLVFAMCSLQEALPSHCGSAERCIRRTIISPKSEYCFAL